MRLALIGDIHGSWDERDTDWFNGSDLDGVLFTGDLPRTIGNEAFRVAEHLAALRLPTAVIAGNHDCATAVAFGGELLGRDFPSRISAGAMARRYLRLRSILGDRLVGYSAARVGDLAVLGARPFAMDGRRLSFAPALERLFGVHSLEQSAQKLCDLADGTPGELIVLAHNGPAGLGARRGDIFGVDFRADEGDNGDADLRALLHHAGGRVRLVVAGHMHHRVRGQRARRPVAVVEGGALMVNAARVPRHREGRGYFVDVDIPPAGMPRVREATYPLNGAGAVEWTDVQPQPLRAEAGNA